MLLILLFSIVTLSLCKQSKHIDKPGCKRQSLDEKAAEERNAILINSKGS